MAENVAAVAPGRAASTDRHGVLFRLIDRLHRAADADGVYQAALDAMFEGLDCQRASILLFDAAGIMQFVASRGLSEGYRLAVAGHTPWKPEDADAAPIVVSDIAETDEPEALKATIRNEGIVGLGFFPLMSGGRLIGKFMTYYNHRHVFLPEEVEMAMTISRQLAFAIARLYAEAGQLRAERELQREREHLAAIVQSSDDAIISKNLDGTIVSWNAAAERLFGHTAEQAIGRSVLMLIPEDRQHEEPDIIRRIRAGERIDHYETVRRRRDGSLFDISLTVSPIKNAQGQVVGASKIGRDITEQKKAESQRNLLIDELNHRVKNTLATVISISRQSFSNPDPKEAQRTFDARIRGMAQTHSRLAESNWSGVALHTLLEDELAPYKAADGSNLVLEGPRVVLDPRSALMLGLALHEMATNAAKYGALSAQGGRLSINWSLDRPSGLSLQWLERGGPSVAAPKRSGFGRLLLERALASDLKAKVEMKFEPEGLGCTIVLPPEHVPTP